MIIALPTHAFTDRPQSGLHTVVWHTAIELGKLGHEVHVLSTWTELNSTTVKELHQQNVHVHTLANFPVHNFSGAITVRCFVAYCALRLRKRFDWIYIPDTSRTPFHSYKLGAKLAVRALAPKTKEVQELLTTGDWNFDRQRKDAEEQWEGRSKPLWFRGYSVAYDLWSRLTHVKRHTDNANLVFCQGSDTLEYWQGKVNAPCKILPNGIDTALFLEEQSSKKASPFRFLFVGRIAKRKGIFQLIDAFLKLPKNTAELHIIGKGSKELVDELQKVIKDNTDITYHGEVSRQEIPTHMYACDMLVDPMIYQGFSTVCLEALFAGKPVITSKFGGTKDFVKQNETGLLVDPRNVDELHAAMSYALDNQAKCETMGTRGHELVRKEYDWSTVIRNVSDSLASA